MMKIPILIYHAIETPDKPIDSASRGELVYIIDSNKFRQQMEYLNHNGYQIISLHNYVINHGKTGEEFSDNGVIITFDDGHVTNYEVAFPILQEFDITATFFIAIRYINTPNGLTFGQLREMARYGMSIQSHTLTHPFLSDLTPGEIRLELRESKDMLENELGQPVDYLALPGGRYSYIVRKIAMEVGYKAVCTSVIGYNSLNSDLYSIKRWSIMRGDDISKFRSIFDKSNSFIAYNKARYILLKGLKMALGNRFYDILREKII